MDNVFTLIDFLLDRRRKKKSRDETNSENLSNIEKKKVGEPPFFLLLLFSFFFLSYYIKKMAHTLSASEAFELHKSAVTRDFIAKPRLGSHPFQKIKHKK